MGAYNLVGKKDIHKFGASLVAQMVKNLPAIQEARVRSLGGEDPLEKRMATHSSILAWRIPWREEPGLLQSTGRKELDMTERLGTSTSIHKFTSKEAAGSLYVAPGNYDNDQIFHFINI